MRRASLLLALALGGCGGQDQAALSGYDRDQTACHDAAVTKVDHDNAKKAMDWFSAPVRRWGQISAATQSCMLAKGHDQTRWCTPDELARARQAGTVVVTEAGVQCVARPGG